MYFLQPAIWTLHERLKLFLSRAERTFQSGLCPCLISSNLTIRPYPALYSSLFLFIFCFSLTKANARNVRPYYPYWQYIDLFIFRFVSLLCLRSTLRLFHTCMFSYHNHYNNNHLKKHSNIIIQNIIRKGYLAGDFLTALTKSPSSLVTTKMKNKNSQKYKQDFSKAHFWLVLKSSS